LTQFVVQLARQPGPLRLLRPQCAPPALRPLVLDAVEHRVERPAHASDLVVGLRDRDAPARVERIDALHRGLEPLERLEDPPEERDVHGDGQKGAGGQDDPLLRRHGRRHRRRRQGQDERREDEQDCVDGDRAPEQRHRSQPGSAVGEGKRRMIGSRSPTRLPGTPGIESSGPQRYRIAM
jgi:hypothetical protein